MVGMRYTAAFDAVAVTALQDVFEIVAPADAVVEIIEIHLGQETEEGDAQAEMLAVSIRSGQTTSGSGGTTVTPAALEPGFAAAGSTVEANNTTQASGGTIVAHVREAFHVAAGWHYVPLPESRIILSPSRRMTVQLEEAPADSATFSGYMVFREIGG